MEHTGNSQTSAERESEKRKKELNALPVNEPSVRPLIYQDTEKDWNSKILKVTMMIREEFPELSKFLNEMPVTIPNEKHPKVDLENLKKYYDSLILILNKYRLEHPHRPKL